MAKIIIVVDIDDVGAEESVSYETIEQYLDPIKNRVRVRRSPESLPVFSILYSLLES